MNHAIDCAASRPSPVPNHYSVPQFDLTGTIVTGWVVLAGTAPAGYVSPCDSELETKIITSFRAVVTDNCVAEPMLVPGYWADPEWNLQHTAVVGWIVKAGQAPPTYVNPCVAHTYLVMLL